MKKTISFSALFLGCIMLAGTTVYAQSLSTTQAEAGDTITLAESAGGGTGPGLEFNPSPKNWMAATSTENNYAINSMNASAPDEQRMEYGVWSGGTGYFQKINPPATGTGGAVILADFSVDLTNSTDVSVNPYSGSDWTPVGGGGS